MPHTSSETSESPICILRLTPEHACSTSERFHPPLVSPLRCSPATARAPGAPPALPVKLPALGFSSSLLPPLARGPAPRARPACGPLPLPFPPPSLSAPLRPRRVPRRGWDMPNAPRRTPIHPARWPRSPFASICALKRACQRLASDPHVIVHPDFTPLGDVALRLQHHVRPTRRLARLARPDRGSSKTAFAI